MTRKSAGCSSEMVIGVILLMIVGLIYKALGPIGFVIAAIVLLILAIWLKSGQSKKTEAEFEVLVLSTIRNRTSPDEARAINASLIKQDHRKADLIRRLQIMRDSIDIALSSKKADTASSRMKLAENNYAHIKQYFGVLVTNEVSDEITWIFQNAIHEFATVKYTNVASALIQKADSLKTNKAMNKYYNQAKAVLHEGLEDSESDIGRINELLNQIPDGMSV